MTKTIAKNITNYKLKRVFALTAELWKVRKVWWGGDCLKASPVACVATALSLPAARPRTSFASQQLYNGSGCFFGWRSIAILPSSPPWLWHWCGGDSEGRIGVNHAEGGIRFCLAAAIFKAQCSAGRISAHLFRRKLCTDSLYEVLLCYCVLQSDCTIKTVWFLLHFLISVLN